MIVKKRYKIKKFKFLFFLLFFLALAGQTLFSQNFYWENPLLFTKSDSRFPQSINYQKNGRNQACVFFQTVNTEKKEISLSLRTYSGLGQSRDFMNFAGPFSYSGDEVPYIYTSAVNDEGVIALSVLASAEEILVLVSKDFGQTWSKSSIKTKGLMVAPRIFSCGRYFKMFISSGLNESFSIYTAESLDGLSWSSLELFSPAAKLRNPFLPSLISNGNFLTVVFQAQYVNPKNGRLSYQLYLTSAALSSRNWSEPVLISGSDSLSLRDSKDFFAYQNQRPFLHNFQGETYLAWERSSSSGDEIWCAKTGPKGLEVFSAHPLVSASSAVRAVLFDYKDRLYACWFDSRRGRESVYMAQKDGDYWSESILCENSKSNQFVYPLFVYDSLTDENILTFIWQENSSKNKAGIDFLSPDRTVSEPAITPLSFRRGKKTARKNLEFQISLPKDSSNIAGYSYSWSQDENEVPPLQIQHFPKETKVKVRAEKDGKYFLKVKAQDYAGNWSKAAVISCQLDTTPPLPPEINLSNTDKYGFISSNSFRIYWKPSEAEDLSHYLYRLDYLSSIPGKLNSSKKHPLRLSAVAVKESLGNLEKRFQNQLEKSRTMTSGQKVSDARTLRFLNYENGVYLFSVSAVDDLGNVGQSSKCLVFLNKFEPSTLITYVDQKKTEYGQTEISIGGKGFTYDGSISKIIFDRDGRAPYDLELTSENSKYHVISDRLINNIFIDLDEGKYRVGLYHTDRGLYFSEPVLKIDQNGTLKIEGEYERPARFTAFRDVKYKITVYFILACMLITFSVFVILAFFDKTALFALEEIRASAYAKELLYNRNGGKIRMKSLSHFFSLKPSLRKKLVGFTFSLIIIVVLGVSLVNGQQIISLQERTLAQGLENRTEVLLESLCTGVKNFFPSNNLLELSALPQQKDAMEEVDFVTIIGQAQNSTSSQVLDYVWATNDPEINQKIDTAELIYGESHFVEEGINRILENFTALDEKARLSEAELSQKIEDSSQEVDLLYRSSSEEDIQKAETLSEVVMSMRNRLDADLLELSKASTGSYPHFDASNLDYQNTDFIFYRPVMYRKGNSGNYVHAIVLVKLSTKILVDAVQAQTRKILIFGSVLTALALVFGMFGASFFALIIVRPIRKLESHVQMVGRTKNKLNLKGKSLKIKSNDEIGRLGRAVDNMTQELVSVAEEEALTMDGKAVQNAFLPLTSDDFNNKKTTASYKDNQVECFGYYEGEDGVSGDYFDYRRLDQEWFVAIKCDASGHGVPAAIIMTVVATIFRRYFEHWTFKRDGCRINTVVNQINDFIEKLGLKGKFATLIICLINLKTGELYTCNAGDRIMHVFEAESKKIRTITLSSAPTAGVFSNDLLQMRGGFAVEKHHLNPGDILFLYTDGIEESTRRIRDQNFNPLRAEEKGKIDDMKEEFGSQRIIQIIEAVLNGNNYQLQKEKNPRQDENLSFDFSRCSKSIEDAVIALASIEKVFRMYRTDENDETAYIKVDKKINEFLKKYFSRYDYYAAHSEEIPDQPNYIDYNQVMEDEQSDDLTLLAIKRL